MGASMNKVDLAAGPELRKFEPLPQEFDPLKASPTQLESKGIPARPTNPLQIGTMMRISLGPAAILASLVSAQTGRAQSQAATDLPRAQTCSFIHTMATAGSSVGTTAIRMSNDGRWCWIDLWATIGSLQYVPKFRVAQAPAHGELVMGEVGKKGRIAYRPALGFAGVDTYTLTDTVTNTERVVTVTVSK
jgi:hypothetical protein